LITTRPRWQRWALPLVTVIGAALLLAAVMIGASTTMTTPAMAATPDTDCLDYPSRDIAQAAFNLHGGSPTNNWNGLDNDHDGIVCEHTVFPTPSASPSPTASATMTPAPPRDRGGDEQLPITGTASNVVAGVGLALLVIGALAIWVTRRRGTR
jgi:LPXTG-motif cell wall-anchored protein